MKENTYRQAKIDLTAALRWAERLGLSEGICNHFSLLVSTAANRFLLNPQGLHWAELKTSDLVVVDPDGNLIDGKWQMEPTAFFIHSRIHRSKPSAKCVLHTHMPYATALCCLEGGQLQWASQNALRFYNRIAYDEQYNGLALDEAEGQRICQKLVNNDIIFLANHGVIVTGPDIATAFDDLYYLERSCMTQSLAQSTGLPLRKIPADVCRQTHEQLKGDRQQSYSHWEAIKRLLKKESPEFLE